MNGFKNMLLILFLLARASPLYAQVKEQTFTYKAIYELNYQPDSTNAASKNTEYMYLFLKEGVSFFQSVNRYLMDSALIAEHQKGNSFGPGIPFLSSHDTQFYNHIFKTADKVDSYETVSLVQSYSYLYSEKRPLLQWKILADTASISGYPCQKAETYFGNRKWTAWFSSEIPFSDGPYKFCGLPGLIVQIQDEQNYWNYTLIGFGPSATTIQPFYKGGKPIILKNKEAYFKRKLEYYKNPLAMDEAMGGFSITNGRELYIEKRQKYGKEHSNWIELYQPKK